MKIRSVFAPVLYRIAGCTGVILLLCGTVSIGAATGKSWSDFPHHPDSVIISPMPVDSAVSNWLLDVGIGGMAVHTVPLTLSTSADISFQRVLKDGKKSMMFSLEVSPIGSVNREEEGSRGIMLLGGVGVNWILFGKWDGPSASVGVGVFGMVYKYSEPPGTIRLFPSEYYNDIASSFGPSFSGEIVAGTIGNAQPWIRARIIPNLSSPEHFKGIYSMYAGMRWSL